MWRIYDPVTLLSCHNGASYTSPIQWKYSIDHQTSREHLERTRCSIFTQPFDEGIRSAGARCLGQGSKTGVRGVLRSTMVERVQVQTVGFSDTC